MQFSRFTESLFPSLRKRRKKKVHQLFNEKRGYKSYHEFCTRQHTRDLELGDSQFAERGFELLNIMPATESDALLEQVIQKSTDFRTSAGGDYLDIMELNDRPFIEKLLNRVITDEMDRRITALFKSEYFVYWHTLSKANPGHTAQRSYKWHCDKGPQNHLKILFFLNGSDEHGGNTEFLERSSTEEFGETGYLFCPVKSRSTDLSGLAGKHGIEYRPERPDIKAGEAYLFEPTNVLHRGILPTKGPRYVLTVCLLPSPVHWRQVFAANSNHIAPNFDWHSHASDLLPYLVPSP